MRIGVDLGGTNLRAGLVDDSGIVRHRRSVPTPNSGGPHRILDEIVALVRSLPSARFVGIGSPGLVDHASGIVRASPNLPSFNGFPLGKELSAALGREVCVANDVNALAWGEYRFGAGRGCRNLLCITLGTGVGGGLIVEGKLFTGKDDTAGEIGHAPLIRDGVPCPCGNRGCLEQYVAKFGIARRAEERGRAGLSPEEIAQFASDGENWAREVYDGVASDLAMALATMIQVFNFEKVIVGGQIAKAGEILFGPLQRHTDRHVYPFLRDKYRIVPAGLGDDGGIVGAAFLGGA